MAQDVGKVEQELKEKFGEDLDEKLLAECMSIGTPCLPDCLTSSPVSLSASANYLRIDRREGLPDAQLHR